MKQEEGRSNKNNNNNNNNNNGNNIDESRSVSLATRHESNSAAAKTVGRRVLLLCSRFVFSFVVVVVVVVVVVGVVVWPAPGYRIALIFRVRTTWPFSPNRERRRTVARLSTARSGFFLSSSSHNGALVNGRLSLSLSLSLCLDSDMFSIHPSPRGWPSSGPYHQTDEGRRIRFHPPAAPRSCRDGDAIESDGRRHTQQVRRRRTSSFSPFRRRPSYRLLRRNPAPATARPRERERERERESDSDDMFGEPREAENGSRVEISPR